MDKRISCARISDIAFAARGGGECTIASVVSAYQTLKRESIALTDRPRGKKPTVRRGPAIPHDIGPAQLAGRLVFSKTRQNGSKNLYSKLATHR